MESLEFLSATLNTRVVFPPPPPTSNSLTSVQRAQLRKSTKKLGQILGETPHLIDEDIVSILGPVHVELPPRNEAPSPVYSDSSLDSLSYFSSSSSSLSHYSHPYAAACATSFEPRPSTPRTSPLTRKPSLGLRSSLDRLTDHFDSHSNINKLGPPILRLAVSPPSSPTSESSGISSSPSLSSSPVSSRTSGKFNSSSVHKRSTSVDDHDIKNHCSIAFPSSPRQNTPDMKFTLHAARPSTAPSRIGLKDYEDDEITESSCYSGSSISASASSVRRRKMERVRKILGYDVPVHLVFPDQEEKKVTRNNSVTSTNIKDYEVVPNTISPIAVAGTATPRSKMNGKITGARDSMGEFSPHKAIRQEHQKISKSSKKQHVKSSSLPSTPSPPALVQAFGPLPSPDADTSQRRLCVIVESPEEHGSSALEGFGLGGCAISTTKPRMTTRDSKKLSGMGQPPRKDNLLTTGHELGRMSQRVKEEEATMNKLWSTRRGYTGWDRSMTLGRISESPLSSALEDEKRCMIGFRKSPVCVEF